MPGPYSVTYVTGSKPKQEENAIFHREAKLDDGTAVADIVSFEFWELHIKETLEVDLNVMVEAEVALAYSQIKVPCIVEHAGLILEDYKEDGYPGGLTKPMWNVFKERFIQETGWAGRKAVARAIVAYCDGMDIRTFVGETRGTLADNVRGRRDFYWDRVFIPSEATGAAEGKTYAEIAEDPTLGLTYKVMSLSQSTKAMRRFVEHLKHVGVSSLWS
jgi:XTP/dITP diphosphohydrolase